MLYQEWGPKEVLRKMAAVGEGGREAAALLWSRGGGVHYELLQPPEDEQEEETGEGDERERTDLEEVGIEVELVTGGEVAEDQGMRGRPGGQDDERLWHDVQQGQIQRGGTGWRYQGQQWSVQERREVGEGSTRDKRQRAGWEGVLGVQLQKMEYEVPEGTGKGEWNRRQEGGVDLWVTGGGEAVLQLHHREDLEAGWEAKGGVELQSDRAVWMEPGWKGRYRVAARRQQCWGWHMTWRAFQGGGLPVRKGWGGELQGGGKGTSTVTAHFTRATLAPTPTTQGHRGQEVVYTFREEMILKAAEAIRMSLDEGTTRMANRTYHLHPHTVEWEVRHGQEARYQYNVPVPNVVVTTAAAEGMKVRIGLSQEGQAVQV